LQTTRHQNHQRQTLIIPSLQRLWRQIKHKTTLTIGAKKAVEVYVNLKKVGKNVLLAMCDCEILGKTLREGKIVFHVKDEFYNGGRLTIEEALNMIGNSNIVNMIGKNCVTKAIQEGYVHPQAVLNIEGVPHAQIMKF
jgi:hypothetical protein